jgi:hypothetical protein
MNVSNEIERAAKPLGPMEVALVIFRNLFERGGGKMSDANKFVALQTIGAGLTVWKKSIEDHSHGHAAEWEKRYKDTKAQLDDVMLKYAILKKES